MYINNFHVLMQMLLDRRVWQAFKKHSQCHEKETSFDRKTLLKTMLHMFKGEKLVKHEGQYVLTSFLPPIPSKPLFATLNTGDTPTFTDRMYSRRRAPVSMYISVTGRCMYNCSHCSAKGRNCVSDLSLTQWQKVIGDLQDMGTAIIGITGGEPLLRDDIEEIIGSIDDRSTSYLFTTGHTLTLEKARRLKERGLFGLAVSLDSYIEEKHNNRRGNKNAFQTAVNAIKIARVAGLYTLAQTVVLKEDLNKEELFKQFRFAKKCGAHEVRVLEPIKSGALLEENDNIFYADENRRKLVEIHHAANRKIGMPKITTFAHTESEEKFGCGAGSQHSYISDNGDLFPCDFVPMKFGNVIENGVKELWQKMNSAMGKPKCRCFAMEINNDIVSLSNGNLPLEPKLACELCKAFQSDRYPKIYRIMQGES